MSFLLSLKCWFDFTSQRNLRGISVVWAHLSGWWLTIQGPPLSVHWRKISVVSLWVSKSCSWYILQWLPFTWLPFSWLPFTKNPIKSEKERNFVEICRHIFEGVGEPMPNQTIFDPAGTGLVHTVVYINRGMPFVFLILSLYVVIKRLMHHTFLFCRSLLFRAGLLQRCRGPLPFTTDGCSIN